MKALQALLSEAACACFARASEGGKVWKPDIVEITGGVLGFGHLMHGLRGRTVEKFGQIDLFFRLGQIEFLVIIPVEVGRL